jgi:hypothetical protein
MEKDYPGVIRPPDGVEARLDDPDLGMARQIMVGTVVLTGLSAAAVAARVYTAKCVLKHIRADDCK